VPFTERSFHLARASQGRGSGYVGFITTNSFLKREFGALLIEEFLPQVDLTNVLDTSGVYIPWHGTPTLILFGRTRDPVRQDVRAARAPPPTT
jgi:hypothetical protein